MQERVLKIVIVLMCSLLIFTSLSLKMTKNVSANQDAYVITDKYTYSIGEQVEITLCGELILTSSTLLDYISYIIRDADGDYVWDQLALFMNVVCAIGYWQGPEFFIWNQTYRVYESHNGSLNEPFFLPELIPPTGEQVPPGKYYIYISVNGEEVSNATEIEIVEPIFQVTMDCEPKTLNLKSKGRWITCYINLPNGYDVNDISSIMLEDVIQNEWGDIQGDTLMVKFDRSEVEDMLSPGTYNIKVTGELTDGTEFEGYSDEIRVIDLGK
jgi:hypothetical protein